MASPARPTVTLIPLLGPLHLRMPQYNAVSVARSTQAFEPTLVALAPLLAGSLRDPSWQDVPHTPLPHTVVPWARRAGVPLEEVGEPIPDPDAEHAFRTYLEGYDGGRALLASVDAEEVRVRTILDRALTLDAVLDELVPAIRQVQDRRREVFGDGPGTGWQDVRSERIAARIGALESERIAVLASVDDLPSLSDALTGRVTLVRPPSPAVDDAIRQRNLLDYAMRAEATDVEALLRQLRDVDRPEARYLEANLLVQHGDTETALSVLEAASTSDFVEPYYLPGFLLARLGQLYDLADRRDAALRCYRGVRALSYAPAEALEAAGDGLEHPFTARQQEHR